MNNQLLLLSLLSFLSVKSAMALTANAGPDQTICTGESAQIGGNPTGSVGSTYAWDNSFSLDNSAVANPTATPTVTTTYSVTVTAGNNTTTVDQMTVFVNPIPSADAGADMTICEGGSVQLGGAPTSTTPGVVYQWNNTASLSSSTVPNPIGSPISTTIYTVTIVSPNGCTSTDQINVTVNPLPSADAGMDQSICPGGSIFIGGSPTGPAGSAYSWSNSSSLNSATNANPIASPLVTTSYVVTVTDPNACTSTDIVLLAVNSIDTSINSNGNSLTSNEPNAQYQWLDCGNGFTPIVGANSQTFIASSNGTYSVEIVKNGCSDTSVCQSVLGVGLESIKSPSFSIYPNPMLDELTISSEAVFSYQLLTVEGKLVLENQQILSHKKSL